ncbi:MAG: EscU/YscU/HrcU family type III secretion system export apparatus switch protein [Myxococcota bacterium]
MSRSREPTEAPTPKRLREARREGRVARSELLTSGVVLGAALGALFLGGGALLVRSTAAAMRSALDGSSWAREVGGAAAALPATVARLALPIAGAALLAALVAGIVQVGPLLAARALRPTRRGKAPGVRLFDAMLCLIIATASLAVTVDLLRDHGHELLAAAGRPTRTAWHIALVLGQNLVLRLVAVALVAGAIELVYRRWALRRGLRMTREEIERERREAEVAPHLRAERKRRQQPDS